MHSVADSLEQMSPPVRWAALGAVVLGCIGALVGLVIGLRTNAPTAWAAVFELGVPAALLGALLGWIAGWVADRAGGASRHGG